MLVAQNSLGPVCPVPLTVRGSTARRLCAAGPRKLRLNAAAVPHIDKASQARALKAFTKIKKLSPPQEAARKNTNVSGSEKKHKRSNRHLFYDKGIIHDA